MHPRTTSAFSDHAPLLASLFAYWIAVAILVSQSLQLSQGYFAYPLDDPYIHMAMAKNLAVHGVWGVTRHEFSSTSSSPLWTALLAGVYRLFGVGEMAPLWLNITAGSLSLWVGHWLLRQSQCGPWWTAAVLMAFIFGSALPTLTITGMEHTLHGLLTLAFAASAIAVIAGQHGARSGFALALLAVALATTRYEGLFAIAVVTMLLLIAGRRMLAVVVATAGLAPIAIYGAWSVSHGWYFLPNSVLLKGNVPDPSFYGFAKLLVGWNALSALQMTPHLVVLLAASLVAVGVRKVQPSTRTLAMTAIFVFASLLHLQFAKTGWFFRYEGYLLMLGLVTVGSAVHQWLADETAHAAGEVGWIRLGAAVILLLIVSAPIAVRGIRAFQTTAVHTKITYDQQVQMGRFLQRYYDGRTIAVNDIGAVNFFGDIKVVDLVGLASMDVARLRRSGDRGPWIESLVGRRADVAIVYDSWLIESGGIPPSWHKVGEWSGSVPDSTVAFYSVGPDQVTELQANLRSFTADLPPTVVASGNFAR